VLKDSFRKLMVYVGLTEDDYDEFGRAEPAERPFTGRAAEDDYDEPWAATAAPSAPTIAPLRQSSVSVLDGAGAPSSPPRRPMVRPAPASSAVRPITTVARDEDLDALSPRSYEDSKRIGDVLKSQRALVVNLTSADADLSRRIVDFSSGVVYTLGGKISKVGPHVYLLVPPNVRVSPEAIARLRHQGFRAFDA
jgi:cell division inhibitor SepF